MSYKFGENGVLKLLQWTLNCDLLYIKWGKIEIIISLTIALFP